MQRSLSIWIATTVALLLATPAHPEPAPRELKLHHMMSAMAPAHRLMLLEWAERIAGASGGRLRVKVFPSMQLGGQAAGLIDQVRDGIVDIGWTLPGYSPGRFPSIEVFELPFVIARPAVMNRAMQEFLQRHPEDFAEVKVLNLFVHRGQVLHSRRPIHRADDLRGMKIRVPSRVGGWIVEALGATPLGSPVQNIPEMLSKGIVDAAYIPYEASHGLKVHELVDYHVTLGGLPSDRIQTQVFILAMNWAVYRGLEPDLRAVIDANSGIALCDWLGEKWDSFEDPGREAARASGSLIELPAAEIALLRDRVEQPVIERWATTVARRGIDGHALLDEARALLRQHGADDVTP